MNNLDKQYTDLLQDILDNGVKKNTRNGEVLSIFGRQIRHKMSDGFPLLTTKKIPLRLIATELLWFLQGSTNIKFLVDNDCHIWDGDAYKNYTKYPLATIHDHHTNILYQNRDKGWCLLNGRSIVSPHPTRHLTQEEFINKIKTDDEFAKKWGELGPIYGKQWRSWETYELSNHNTYVSRDGMMNYRKHKYDVEIKQIDQIANLINDLKTNPDSRRLMVNSWNVGELDQMTLPPCHYGFQVYTRELSMEERHQLALPIWKEKYGPLADMMVPTNVDNTPYKIPTRTISLIWNQRSVDTFLGLPFNIASYGLLLEIIAKAVNMVPDELIGNLGDTHLYSNHIEQAKEQIGRDRFELPTLNINTEFWPYEGGECGEGPLDAVKVFEAFNDENFCRCLLEEDLQLSNYQSHPSIKAPLSN